jgi:hypothetical protein
VRQEVEDSFPSDQSEAKSLARDMHDGSQTFLSEMMAFSGDFFDELMHSSDTTEEEAWELLSALIKRIFEEFRKVWASAANAARDKNPVTRCSTYLWASIQAHRVMKEMIDARFRNHVSIAPVIILHVFKTRITKVAHTAALIIAGVDVWFCDVDPPSKLSLWVSHTQYIITTRRARNTMELWRFQHLALSHADCGGVTTGLWNLFIYSMPNDKLLLSPPVVAGRDLSTILNTKVEGMPCPAPEVLPQLVRKVIEVRPNTYHGGGLLPWGCFQGKVVAPCIFSKSGWVRRKLTGGEVLKALDIPDELETSLTSSQIKTICSDSAMLPLKVTLALIDAIPSRNTFAFTAYLGSKRVRSTEPENKAIGNCKGTEEVTDFDH